MQGRLTLSLFAGRNQLGSAHCVTYPLRSCVAACLIFKRCQSHLHLQLGALPPARSHSYAMATTEDAKAKPGTAAEGMGVAKGGWFTELSTLWPGQGLSLKVDEVLFQDRSKFQVCQHSLELARVCMPGAFQLISHSGMKHANQYCRQLRSTAPAWLSATYEYGICLHCSVALCTCRMCVW